MEDKHQQRLRATYNRLLQHKRVVVLDIPDDYRYMDPELIELLLTAVVPLLPTDDPQPCGGVSTK
jgi:predicted protein tyrosine phosphatase